MEIDRFDRRVTALGQMAKGMEGKSAVDAAKELEHCKWFLWHGNVLRALQLIGDPGGGPRPRGPSSC